MNDERHSRGRKMIKEASQARGSQDMNTLRRVYGETHKRGMVQVSS